MLCQIDLFSYATQYDKIIIRAKAVEWKNKSLKLKYNFKIEIKWKVCQETSNPDLAKKEMVDSIVKSAIWGLLKFAIGFTKTKKIGWEWHERIDTINIFQEYKGTRSPSFLSSFLSIEWSSST